MVVTNDYSEISKGLFFSFQPFVLGGVSDLKINNPPKAGVFKVSFQSGYLCVYQKSHLGHLENSQHLWLKSSAWLGG